ncbi:MAG: hypothetical protein HYR91_01445 [Flavobacteriia bacterium]|nr:hypothetical protein [Flavobacteriia bacterium]
MNLKSLTIALFLIFGLLLSFVSTPEYIGKCSGDTEYKLGLTKLNKYKLIKDYRVKLKDGTPENPPTINYMISLKAGLKYKFLPMNIPDNKSKMIMSIYLNKEKTVLLATTFNKLSGKHYPSIDFNCKTTGTFYLFFEFENGMKGCGVGLFAVEN